MSDEMTIPFAEILEMDTESLKRAVQAASERNHVLRMVMDSTSWTDPERRHLVATLTLTMAYDGLFRETLRLVNSGPVMRVIRGGLDDEDPR